MTIQHLLTRNYKVQHPEGQSHRIKEIQVRAGQSLARGEALCSLEYKRKGRLSSPDTVYLAECAFDVDQHEVVDSPCSGIPDRKKEAAIEE